MLYAGAISLAAIGLTVLTMYVIDNDRVDPETWDYEGYPPELDFNISDGIRCRNKVKDIYEWAVSGHEGRI